MDPVASDEGDVNTEPGGMAEQPRPPALAAAPAPRRLSRWFRARKRRVRDRAVTVVAILLIQVVVWTLWWWYSQWRLGRIVLTNSGILLVVEVLPETGDEALGEPLDLVSKLTLTLPAGDYRLRIERSRAPRANLPVCCQSW